MWQDEWPTERGWWWFYGYRFKFHEDSSDKKELCLVEVLKTAAPKVFSYVTRGHWIYKDGGAKGKWQKAVLPELPKEDA